MSKAIRFYETGGPEVLKLESVAVGEPGPGQARVRHTYVAVNFIDIYFRTGTYPLPLPMAAPAPAPAPAPEPDVCPLPEVRVDLTASSVVFAGHRAFGRPLGPLWGLGRPPCPSPTSAPCPRCSTSLGLYGSTRVRNRTVTEPLARL